MNVKRLALYASILFFMIGSVGALGSPFWLEVRVTSNIGEELYDTVAYWNFTAEITDSGDPSYVPPSSMGCLLPKTLMSSPPETDTFYNFTGRESEWTDIIPEGWFVIEQVNTREYSDWTQIIIDIINTLSGVMSGIVHSIAEIIAIASGGVIMIPEILLTLLIVGALAYTIIKHLKTLSILLILIVGFLFLSGGANIFRLALEILPF